MLNERGLFKSIVDHSGDSKMTVTGGARPKCKKPKEAKLHGKTYPVPVPISATALIPSLGMEG